MSASAAISAARLGDLVGAGNVLTDSTGLARYAIDGLLPVAAVRPGSAEEVAETIRFAAAEKLAVILVGGGTKLQIGMPPRRYDLAIDTTRLNRILAYDPGDLTLSVEAGIHLPDLQRVLAEKRQFLPLLVPFYSEATLGGVLAAHSTSPLRQFYGTPRDFLLGMEFVTGEGTRAKSGGRVVKNVAGYDLHKVMLGSLGTLGAITVANFKTFPLPPVSACFVASFARAEAALEFSRAIARSPLAPHTFDIVSPEAARILEPRPHHLPAGSWSVMLAAGGTERVVERHAWDFQKSAEQARAESLQRLTMEEKSVLWGQLREFPRLVTDSSAAATLVKISVLPTQFSVVLEQARRIADQQQLPSGAVVRAAGLVYLALIPRARDGNTIERLARAADEVFDASIQAGGRAVIESCPLELKQKVNVWGPPPDDWKLMKKLKSVFDPQGILSPGRFIGGL